MLQHLENVDNLCHDTVNSGQNPQAGESRVSMVKRLHIALVAFFLVLNTPATSVAEDQAMLATVAPVADLIVLYKSQRQLVLYNNATVLRSYEVDLGDQPEGDKTAFGDGRTPEGTYFIDRMNPNSAYHLSLGISYPNETDIAEAAALGVDPGGDIFIHGGPTRFWDHFKRDWTAGCIAVTNREIEEIWSLVRVGTPIVIVP